MRTAGIRLKVTPEQAARLSALQRAYADACNRLVPLVQAARCWNRVALHQLGYRALRQQTSLGAQLACNAIFSVCKAYRSQGALGRISQDTPVPPLSFERTSVHFDHRTYTLKGEALSLNTLQGRMRVPMILGDHQRQILASGLPKEAELVFRRGKWLFNLAVESADGERVTSGPVMAWMLGKILSPPPARAGSGAERHCAIGVINIWPCVVASSPTAARVPLKDSGRSPARSGGVSDTSITKRARRFSRKPDALARPRS